MNSALTVFNRLQSDALTASELDTFDGLPAIFDDNAPDGFVFGSDLVIIIAAPTRNEADPTFSEQAWTVERDLRLYMKHTGSNARLDAVAEHVRDLFHLKPEDLYVDGGTVTICTASGPVASPASDPSLLGRRVSLRLTIQET
jgi:hypothetical protein